MTASLTSASLALTFDAEARCTGRLRLFYASRHNNRNAADCAAVRRIIRAEGVLLRLLRGATVGDVPTPSASVARTTRDTLMGHLASAARCGTEAELRAWARVTHPVGLLCIRAGV